MPYMFQLKLVVHHLSTVKGKLWTSSSSGTSVLGKHKLASRSAHGFPLITQEAWTMNLLALRWLASSLRT